MEDLKTIAPPSSPNISASGNNENESENHRNSQEKSKNFMSPTISASSKFISPKKKILAEWKPKNLDSNSEIDNLGISNPNPNSEIPPSSSPKNNLLKSSNEEEEEEEEEAFVADSSTVPPYDPLTNYLSPRPKFLRYNPNRKRKLFLQGENEISSLNSEVSAICQSSCSSESSSVEGSNHVIQQELNEEIEEEVHNWGFKWVFFKSLLSFFAWLLLTFLITSMKDYTVKNPEKVRVIEVEYKKSVDLNFRVVSLRSFDHRNWMVDQRNESENGEFGNVDDGSKVKEVEVEGRRRTIEDEMEEGPVSEEEANAKLLEYEMNHIDSENENEYDDQIEVYDELSHTVNWFPEVSPYSLIGSLSDFVVAPQNEEFEVNMMKSDDGVLEEKKVDDEFVPKSASESSELKVVLSQKVEGVDENGEFGVKMKDGVLEEKKVDDDFVPKPVNEVEIVGSESFELKDVSSQKIEEGNDETVSVGEPVREVESEVKVENVISQMLVEEEKIGGDETIRLTQMEYTLLVAVSVVVCVCFAVMKCYGKWRRKFLGSGSSRRGKLLPLKVGEEDDQIHEKAVVTQRNLPPRSGVVGAVSASRIVPRVQQLGEVEYGDSQVRIGRVGGAGASRIVPRVGQLGEVEYGDSQVRSGGVQQETNVFSVTDDRRAKRSKGYFSSTTTTSATTFESHSLSSNLQEQDSKEKVSAIRRSKRIQDRVATSP